MSVLSFTWLLINPTAMKIPVSIHQSQHFKPSLIRLLLKKKWRNKRKSLKSTQRNRPLQIGLRHRSTLLLNFWKFMAVISRWLQQKWPKQGTKSNENSKFFKKSSPNLQMPSSKDPTEIKMKKFAWIWLKRMIFLTSEEIDYETVMFIFFNTTFFMILTEKGWNIES